MRESTTYTVTSGSLRTVIHEGVAASGKGNVTGLTLQNVVAEDPAGNVYSLRSAFWFGGALNAQQGAGAFADTGKLQVISNGSGTVDSVNVTFHVSEVNSNVKAFDFGTCEEPEKQQGRQANEPGMRSGRRCKWRVRSRHLTH